MNQNFLQEFIQTQSIEKALGQNLRGFREQFILNKDDLSARLRSDYAPYRFTHFFSNDSSTNSSYYFKARVSRLMINVDNGSEKIVSLGILVEGRDDLLGTMIEKLGQPYRKFAMRIGGDSSPSDLSGYNVFYWKINGCEIMLNLMKSNLQEQKDLKMKPLIMCFEENAKTIELG